MELQVAEIFKSIQGEGTLQGEVTAFIRLGGCNIHCAWCDTQWPTVVAMSVDEVAARAAAFGVRFACITGGEPLLQKPTSALIDVLKRRRLFVSVETNGTLSVEAALSADLLSVDYKLQGAHAETAFCPKNFDLLRASDELKFVVSDRPDYEEACRVIEAHPGLCKFLMSPRNNDLGSLPSWMLSDAIPARLSVQLHKMIGVE